jgi:hypothetical protein
MRQPEFSPHYTGVLDQLLVQLSVGRPLAEVRGEELADLLE